MMPITLVNITVTNDAHHINFDALRAAVSRRRLRLDPDDGVVKGVEGLHVELAVEAERRAWRQVIFSAARQH